MLVVNGSGWNSSSVPLVLLAYLFIIIFFWLLGLFSRKQKDWFIIILTYNDALLRCWCFLVYALLSFFSWWYKLVGKECRVLLHFCFVSLLSYYVKALRYTFFPPCQYRIESPHKIMYRGVLLKMRLGKLSTGQPSKSHPRWVEHYAILDIYDLVTDAEPGLLRCACTTPFWPWGCITHSFPSIPFTVPLPSLPHSLSLSLTFLPLLSRLFVACYAAICCNYQVAGRRGTWFSFSIAPTRWLKEKFERFVSNAAGSLARRKPKCLSNKPITSSKRQDPIFIASTRSQVWNSVWRWNEDSLLCRISSWLFDWTHRFIRPKN